MEIRERDQEEGDEGRDIRWFVAPLLVYLIGTFPDESGELIHHQVHALQTRSFQFEDLLFHHGLECQVRGEEPRSERAFAKEEMCCIIEGERKKKQKEKEKNI